MSIPYRNARALTRVGALFLLGGALFIAPAQARLQEPGYGGPLSGGTFSGLPIRQESVARPADPEVTGVANDSCYTLRQQARDRFGVLIVRTAQICE